MDVVIGREPGVAAPRLCIKEGNNAKYLGQQGSVPKTVSRNHCRVESIGDGKYRITNISNQNSVFVNGLECQTKTICKDDLVELGADHYKLNLSVIIKAFAKEEPKTYSISHLKKVWDEYSQAKLEMQIDERKFNALSTIPGTVSLISFAMTFIPRLQGLRVVFIPVAAIFALVFVVFRFKIAKNVPLKQRELDDIFQDNYICPNPECHHFLGNNSYKLILKNGSCPYCKSKFIQ